MQKVQDTINKFASLYQNKKILVAYSGGIDSHVLLHSLSMVVPASNLYAVHINYQQTPQDSEWAEFCRAYTTTNKINFIYHEVNIAKVSGNIEKVARDIRYDFFNSIMDENCVLVTGHHADDQAETILLRIMRGSGVDGLCGIPRVRSLGKGILVRPLLEVTKADIHSHAKAKSLNWVEDKSNSTDRYDRNYMRNNIIPALTKRWPHAVTSLNQVAQNCQRTTAQVQDKQVSYYQSCVHDNKIKVDELNVLELADQYSVIRMWFKNNGLMYPSKNVLNTIINNVANAGFERTKAGLTTTGFECVRKKDQNKKFILVLKKY